jgi:hypothetical protein
MEAQGAEVTSGPQVSTGRTWMLPGLVLRPVLVTSRLYSRAEIWSTRDLNFFFLNLYLQVGRFYIKYPDFF